MTIVQRRRPPWCTGHPGMAGWAKAVSGPYRGLWVCGECRRLSRLVYLSRKADGLMCDPEPTRASS